VIHHRALAAYLNDYLACDAFKDYAPNGLQIEGRANIQMICTAVTASLDVIQQAVALEADALLVHHGYFWRGESQPITGIKYHRIANLIKHDVNLFGYHLPLDCHLTIGNNACLGRLLRVSEIQTHAIGDTPHLLWSGRLQDGLTPEGLSQLIDKQLHRMPLHIPGTTSLIEQIAWCTGAAEDYIEHAARLGVDAFLSGEISERTYHEAQELGLHYYSVGHHASERYGIQALGQHLSERFDIQHHFIDSSNPV